MTREKDSSKVQRSFRTYYCPTPPLVCPTCYSLCGIPEGLAYERRRDPKGEKRLRPNAMEALVCIRCGLQPPRDPEPGQQLALWLDEI